MSEQVPREQNNYYRDREILLASGTNTPPFTMAFKMRHAKIVAVLREDTVAAVMLCDGNPHQFIVKLRGVGCFQDNEENQLEKKEKALESLTTLLLNKIVSLRCYIHTSFNELICTLRLGGKDVLKELLEDGTLPAFSHIAHMTYYPPTGIVPFAPPLSMAGETLAPEVRGGEETKNE